MAYNNEPKDIIYFALIDAIEHVEALVESYTNNAYFVEELEYNSKKLGDYRSMLKNRYGDSRTPMERHMERGVSITLPELRAQREGTKGDD